MSEETANEFTSLEKEALICGRCGYCRSACPVYNAVGWESAAPRGKISMAREIFSHGNQTKCSAEFVGRMAQCTLCGACASECSTAIDTRKLWLELRKRIAELGKEPKAYRDMRNNLLARKNISTYPLSSPRRPRSPWRLPRYLPRPGLISPRWAGKNGVAASR